MLIKNIQQFIFLSIFLAVTCNTFAQKEAAIWYFGEYAGVDFNSGTPVGITDSKMYTQEGCATISDSNGSLLFYTDGVTVWDKSHNVMANGDGLLGHFSSTQSAIIVPQPLSSNIYYIFTVHSLAAAEGLNYSVVDMSLNGGLGEVTQKNIPLYQHSTEKITAVMHANGVDVWVISHEWNNDVFVAHLVTPAGISNAVVKSSVGYNLAGSASTSHSIGYLKASPDGSKLAICHMLPDIAQLLDFNTATGEVSNPIDLPSYKPYGAEFSKSSKVLYIASLFNTVHQYDLQAPDILASQQLVYDGLNTGAIQIGIDGKIYFVSEVGLNQYYLSVINNPDVIGLGCNVVQGAVDLKGKAPLLGLPPFIQTFFNAEITAINFCLGETTEIELNNPPNNATVVWDFGDGNTGTGNTTTNTYAASGNYTITANITTPSRVKVVTKNITILESAVANSVTNYNVCDTDNDGYVNFVLANKDAEALGSQNSADYLVSYYETRQDAQNAVNALDKNSYTNTTAYNQDIFVRIENKNSASCVDFTSFSLEVYDNPVAGTATKWNVCDDDNDGFYAFNLSEKDTEILNGQDPVVFSVSYYLSQDEADADNNPITGTITNTTALQTLFYRLENSGNAICYTTGSFQIEVFITPIAYTANAMVVCGDSIGNGSFMLTNQNTQILNGQDPVLFSVSYHATFDDASQNIGILPSAYTTNNAQETIYARVTNSQYPDCFDISSFDILVNTPPEIYLEDSYVICSDNPTLELDAGNFESYQWKNEQGILLSNQRYFQIPGVGMYSLTVSQTNNGISCSTTHSFETKSSNVATDFNYSITHFVDKENLEISVVGTGDFEYSIDGVHYQISNTFSVFPGSYVVYVRDTLLCRTLTKEITVLGYQKFFTPNGDGKNDFWNVSGSQYFSNTSLGIYDRYGKLIVQINPNDIGWDGTYQGRPLPASDYWFLFTYGQGKTYKGHFTLKR